MRSRQARVLRFYGEPPTGWHDREVLGRIIVFEGPDGAGRSTHIRLIKEWLEDMGLPAVDTGLTRSDLAGRGIDRAKTGHRLDAVTLNLFYATDFCDRLERVILPSARAGMVVLADRYFYSLIARACVRGMPREWMDGLYSFAPIPDKVIYLDVDVDQLLPRALHAGNIDYWESGQDFLKGTDPHSTYIAYQTDMIRQLRELAGIHSFDVVDARGPITQTFESIRGRIEEVIADIV